MRRRPALFHLAKRTGCSRAQREHSEKSTTALWENDLPGNYPALGGWQRAIQYENCVLKQSIASLCPHMALVIKRYSATKSLQMVSTTDLPEDRNGGLGCFVWYAAPWLRLRGVPAADRVQGYLHRMYRSAVK